MSSFIGDSTPRRVALYVVAAFLLYKVVKPRRKIPPGPLAIPLLGNLYMLEPPTDDAHKGEMPKTHRVFKDLADKYGPVFSFWFGFKLTIVISSPQLFHDAMKKQSVVFSGRFSPPSMHIITRNAGIALNEDQDAWRKFRSALLHALSSKQQGERTEPVILDEVRSTIHNFSQREEVGGFVELHDFRLQMRRESINVIMRCMFDFRYGVSLSSEFRDIDGIMEMTFARIAAGNPSDFIPVLRLLPASKSLRELQDITDKRDKYIGSWLEHHRKTLDPTKPRDVLDELLVQQPKTGMTDEDIVVICWDAMAGGIDTSAATFEWAVYILIKNPRAQKKLHEELDRVVGPNRLPKYADAKNLPYSVATLMEVMRYRHFAPFGIPHATTDDAELGGYSIPKGTQAELDGAARYF